MEFLRKLIFAIVFLLILWIAASLIALNKDPIMLDILFIKLEQKLGVILLAAFAVGWLFGILSMFLPWMKRANKARVLGKQLKTKEKEVENLRQLPMSDPDSL